jgi:D-alanine-D-alanine ligase
MDKVIQKQICSTSNIPQTKYVWLTKHNWQEAVKNIVHQLENQEKLSLFVKPASAGSSVGVTKVKSPLTLSNAVEKALAYENKVIIEEAIPCARELEVSIIGNDKPEASVLGEIIPSNEFYDYDAKYISGKSKIIIPASLSDKKTKEIQKIALKTYTLLCCTGLARVDFLINKKTNQFFLNEINTMPGFTEYSMYPKLWQATGLTYKKMLNKLITLAFKQHELSHNLQTSYIQQTQH